MILALTSDTLTTVAALRLRQHRDPAAAVADRAASARSPWAAARCPRCASSSSRTSSTATASAWRTCGPRSAAANADSAKGDIDQGDQRYEVTSNDQATAAADYKRSRDRLPQQRAGPAARRRRRAATANENIRNIGLYNGKPAVGVIVYPIPGANIVATDAADPHGSCRRSRRPCRTACSVNVAMDRSQSVNAAVGDTERTLCDRRGAGDRRGLRLPAVGASIWIPAVALPLSIIGTFGPMYLMGYSIDNLSLMALTIGTGFVVDDAVVVLENIVRHLDAGPRRRAKRRLRGSAEVGFTVVSMSLSLIAVFIPILLMPGIVGLLFHEFAVTLSIAILISMVISLTITPCMCAYVLKDRERDDPSRARWARLDRSASSSASRMPMRAGCMPCSTIRCWSASC